MSQYPPESRLRVEWVATPPGGAHPKQRQRPPRRYHGPPAYPAIPRWGFPLLSWRWPLALPNKSRVYPVERVESLGATAVSMLWITAAVAAGAAGAELWRYVLLLFSRGGALSKTALAISDALVATTGILTWVLGVLCGLTVVVWTLRARTAAAERTGTRPARSDRQFIAGTLIPGVNLVVPGSVLAELEHTVLIAEGSREHAARPAPSRLVMVWWAAWVVSLVLGWLTVIWNFRDGVQAMADGVVLHMWNDVSVVVLAVVTIRVVKYLARLITPIDTTELSRLRVLSVHGAPTPGRLSRPADAPR